ncbi:MAG: transposase [Chloroflexi bacterium]|nr:transposase [Chloroflexota bacterium]
MILNENGRIVKACWDDLPSHYAHVELGAFVVMPNHMHGIIILRDEASVGAGYVGAGLRPAATRAKTEIVRALKSFSARRINQMQNAAGAPVWQRNYYEHIIRNESEWQQIADYIENNPARWEQGQLRPGVTGFLAARERHIDEFLLARLQDGL